MRILLTGACGCLGRAVRRQAAGRHEIVSVDLEPREETGLHHGDFTDTALMRRLMDGCDAVIHTAALHGRHRQTHTAQEFTSVNVLGLQRLLELAVELGVGRFVFSSTMEVVIGRTWDSSGMSVVDEDTPPAPDWIYPLNKLLCEQLGRYFQRQHGLAFTALRYMWFADEPATTPHLLARFVTPDDAARANLLAAERNERDALVLHIGPPSPLTTADIVRATADPGEVVDRHWPGASQALERAGVELGLSHFWPVTRIERARAALGWVPEVGFGDYLGTLGWEGGCGAATRP